VNVNEDLGKRHPKSRSRGRRRVPAETVRRLLVLKRIRNRSYQTLEREVQANMVHHHLTCINPNTHDAESDQGGKSGAPTKSDSPTTPAWSGKTSQCLAGRKSTSHRLC
jgi:hypothetical protein